MKKQNTYEFMVAGVSSGSGKTTVTLGIISALKNRGLSVSAFKCGPDYIDTSYHSFVSGNPAINLDLWMMEESGLKECFKRNSNDSDCSIIEGVMGLFDGVDSKSNFGSSAHIAEMIDVPVILVVDCSGMARSLAAVVKGYCEFMPELKVAGIIANRVGSSHHANLLKDALDSKKLPPLLGYLTIDNSLTLEERHLGLIPEVEKKQKNDFFIRLAEKIEKEINIDLLLECSVKIRMKADSEKDSLKKGKKIKIGVAKDEAFSFYYPENLRAFENAGADLVYFSPIHDKKLPKKLDMIYIGGGYPEIYVEELSNNSSMKDSIKAFAESGKTVYAECGGLMYLSSKLVQDNGISYSMCEVLPITTVMDKQLRRLGYREIQTTIDSLLGPAGTTIRGHEYHYSYMEDDSQIINIYKLSYPLNSDLKSVGYMYNNVLASYVHLYWGSNSKIAENIISYANSIK